MKTTDEKIGKIKKNSRKGVAKSGAGLIMLLLLMTLFTSCEKAWYGRDGRPGRAFISLNWTESEPWYIDAGTGAIPPRFYWGEYYRISPGTYDLYYEGEVWTGQYWAEYAWSVTYEIWVIPGEKGDWYYNGSDGPDNYFDIELSPWGPYVYNSYKNSKDAGKLEIIEDKGSSVTAVQKGEGMEMRITYRKCEPRQRDDKKADMK
ncbi:MAG: hypothetical protein Kow00127_18410 [Bacteroidales bacterium]